MASSELTETDRHFLEVAMTCLKSPPELDIQKMAVKMNIKPKTVSNRWGELKKKIFADNNGSANGAGNAAAAAAGGEATDGNNPVPTTPTAAVTPRKRKSGENADGTPAKKTPRSRAKKTAPPPALAPAPALELALVPSFSGEDVYIEDAGSI